MHYKYLTPTVTVLLCDDDTFLYTLLKESQLNRKLNIMKTSNVLERSVNLRCFVYTLYN